MYVYMCVCVYVRVCVCVCVCVYIYICMCIFFINKACPITLGNTTCRVNLVVHQEASFTVSLYIVQNFFDFSFVIVSQSLYKGYEWFPKLCD